MFVTSCHTPHKDNYVFQAVFSELGLSPHLKIVTMTSMCFKRRYRFVIFANTPNTGKKGKKGKGKGGKGGKAVGSGNGSGSGSGMESGEMPVNMGSGSGMPSGKGKGGKGSGESEEKMEMGMCLSKDEVSFSRNCYCCYDKRGPTVICHFLPTGSLPLCHGHQHAGQV